jgi:hypothetical protein
MLFKPVLGGAVLWLLICPHSTDSEAAPLDDGAVAEIASGLRERGYAEVLIPPELFPRDVIEAISAEPLQGPRRYLHPRQRWVSLTGEPLAIESPPYPVPHSGPLELALHDLTDFGEEVLNRGVRLGDGSGSNETGLFSATPFAHIMDIPGPFPGADYGLHVDGVPLRLGVMLGVRRDSGEYLAPSELTRLTTRLQPAGEGIRWSKVGYGLFFAGRGPKAIWHSGPTYGPGLLRFYASVDFAPVEGHDHQIPREVRVRRAAQLRKVRR